MQFQLTRWLAGRSGPAGQVKVERLACVEAGQPRGQMPLPMAEDERRYLTELAAACPGLEDASPSPATGVAVEALLDQGGVQLWHFASHGLADFTNPNEAVLILADGHRLRPEDLHGPRQTHIAKDRPLAFLNACQVGQQGWALTRLGGWAAAWVDRCRCGAFIGPLWSVNDRLAYEFGKAFYEALRAGQTLGQALQAARQKARELDPDDPTWLAYSVYGHPNGRVRFGRGY
jgi:CHAT domain-containing protein